MPLFDRIKPISYLMAHAAGFIRTLADQPEPVIDAGRVQPAAKVNAPLRERHQAD